MSRQLTLLLNALFFAVLYLTAWVIYKDFGVSIDEQHHMQNVGLYFAQWRSMFGGEAIDFNPNRLRYGPLFNLIAHPFVAGFSLEIPITFAAYQTKHMIIFHAALVSFVMLAIAFRKACNIRLSLALSVVMLATIPIFFGHSFYNPKDIPFASAYTFASILLALRTPRILTLLRTTEPEHNKLIKEGLLIALAGAVAMGVRYAGLMVIFCWLLVIVYTLRKELTHEVLRRVGLMLAVAGGLIAVAFCLFYPAFMQAPFTWLTESNEWFASGTARRDCDLIYGRCVNQTPLQRFYQPVLFLAQTPLLHLVLGAAGVFFFLKKRRFHTPLLKYTGLMLLLQFAALPIFIFIVNVNVYDTTRHIMFIYPALAFFAGYGFVQLLGHAKKASYFLLLWVALAAASGKIIYEYAQLHPYEQAYYNEIVRLFPMQGKWQYGYFLIGQTPLLVKAGELFPGPLGIKYQPLFAWFPLVLDPNEYGISLRPRPPYLSTRVFMVSPKPPRPPRGCEVMYQETRMLGSQQLLFGDILYCTK